MKTNERKIADGVGRVLAQLEEMIDWAADRSSVRARLARARDAAAEAQQILWADHDVASARVVTGE